MNVTEDPRTIEETRQHIRDGERLIPASYSSRGLCDQVRAAYPNGINRRALRVSAQSLELAP